MLWRVGPLARLRPLLDAPDADRLAAGLRLSQELTRREQQQVAAIREQLDALEVLRDERTDHERELTELRRRSLASRRDLSRTIRSRRGLLEQIREESEVRQKALAELERARQELAEIVAGRAEASEVDLDTHAFRGLFRRPVPGRVSQAFGDRRDPRFGTVIPHPGWDMEAPFGTSVRAPFEGRVAFADWFRGYGLVVVLDHGRGVHSVYAHLSAILVERGERVEARDLLGKVGDTGSLRGPYLYLEIRVNGKAEDPAQWIVD